jgi:broad specificity phosphatase PhoE
VTDSPLTNHGALQIDCLAEYFSNQGLRFTKVFSSDLKRASATAQALCHISCPEQRSYQEAGIIPILSPDIRERNFGSLEGQCWSTAIPSKPHQALKAKESESSMKARATKFLDENILPHLVNAKAGGEILAVVSHGIILTVLYRCLSSLFSQEDIHLPPHTDKGDFSMWSNTGFLELDITELTTPVLHDALSSAGETHADDVEHKPFPAHSTPSMPPLAGWQMRILTINNQAHLSNLKRTRGGIGASQHDKRQKKIDGFFAKPKSG